MMTRATSDSKLERMRLGFAGAARKHFGFLVAMGFTEVGSTLTTIRYQKGGTELAVYHGRRSFELGFEATRCGERYSIEELIRVEDPGVAGTYRNFVATAADEVDTGLAQLGALVRRYCARALSDDSALYAALKVQRTNWAEGFALDVLAAQMRPKAEAAFRSGDYRQAAELYERIRPALSASELKRLALAQARAQM